jgi:hypothetical protein
VADAPLHADLELFLTGYVRGHLDAHPDPRCHGWVVSNREPSAGTSQPDKLIVLRDDSGPDRSIISAERAVGATTIAGTREQPADLVFVAAVVHQIMRNSPSTDPDNPVAAVTASSGPFAVTGDAARARRYSTFTLIVVAPLP